MGEKVKPKYCTAVWLRFISLDGRAVLSCASARAVIATSLIRFGCSLTVSGYLGKVFIWLRSACA